MKIDKIKSILRPLVEETIKKMIFEEGLLSNIISEVVKGMQMQAPVQASVQTVRPTIQQENLKSKQEQATALRIENQLREQKANRKALLDSIGSDAYNGVDIFAGTEPLRESASQSALGSSKGHGANPFDGIDPNDSGVNIASLMGNAGTWNKMLRK